MSILKRVLLPVAGAFILAYALPVAAGPVAYGAAAFLGAIVVFVVTGLVLWTQWWQ
jgi:hypothetical protein